MPLELGSPVWALIVVAVELFADAPPQRIVLVVDAQVFAVLSLLDADQALFGVVFKTLDGVAADAFFAQAAEAVVAVALVFEHLYAVEFDVAAQHAGLHQVGSGVVVEGFAVLTGRLRGVLVVLADALGRVVAVMLAEGVAFAVAVVRLETSDDGLLG